MPRILEANLKTPGVYEVRVRPDGSAAASGRILASADELGLEVRAVGTWCSKDNEDGCGEANTDGGVWLFAEQTARSPAFPIVRIS
ncbi:MAG TPA: hypothetical protein VFQ61_11480 [Polyangiaceae bacterium]|nr:hypothetical protein [Polyangiaceae bacterium]